MTYLNLGGSDQEESGSESEDEVPNGEENEESEEDSSDDEDDDDEESEDEGEVDENLRNNMKVALGKAAIDSDEEVCNSCSFFHSLLFSLPNALI